MGQVVSPLAAPRAGTARHSGRPGVSTLARPAILAALIAALGVPLGASTAQQSLMVESEAAANAAPELASTFEGAFEPLDTERADLTAIDPRAPADAVDMSRFDPPVEPAPTTTALGSGVASYYGRQFHGRRTASGEAFDMGAMTAAHRTLPFGSLVRVTNPRNGRSVTVRINDRGPFSHGRTIDLSHAAAEQIGLIARGHGMVELELLAR